ncbi:MAG: transglutaminase family protein, partial [Kiritimatiellaeota bacterium]|nr:transglutaminase family protein [Kiritimatiellota bacterium]
VPRTEAVTEGTVVGDRVRTTSGGYERTGPYPKGSLGPYAFHRRLLRERKKGEGAEFKALLFSPELGSPVETTILFGPKETVLVQGRRRRLQRVRQTLAIRPGHPDEFWVDRSGEVLLTRSPVPMLGTVRVEQCSRATALTPESPVELMSAAVLHSPALIAAPRRLAKAEYVLTFPEDAVRGLYSGDGQQVEMLGPGRARVRVEARVPDPADGYAVPIAPNDRLVQWLRPTAFLESDHPLIREMAAVAAGDLTNSVALASALESYVQREIHSKTLDMGFAGALEAARTRRGDCSEHAVLLAALGRALGIPSRIVVGLVYVDRDMFGVHDPNGLFVFHVWTELLALPGAWVPVDAAMGGFDATHIALTKSALDTAAPLADLCLPVLDIVDRLRIESVQVEP